MIEAADWSLIGGGFGGGVAVALGILKTIDKWLPSGGGKGRGPSLEAVLQKLSDSIDHLRENQNEEIKILREVSLAITILATKIEERFQ